MCVVRYLCDNSSVLVTVMFLVECIQATFCSDQCSCVRVLYTCECKTTLALLHCSTTAHALPTARYFERIYHLVVVNAIYQKCHHAHSVCYALNGTLVLCTYVCSSCIARFVLTSILRTLRAFMHYYRVFTSVEAQQQQQQQQYGSGSINKSSNSSNDISSNSNSNSSSSSSNSSSSNSSSSNSSSSQWRQQ
jgi:uncharacterized membrane protein YgcG